MWPKLLLREGGDVRVYPSNKHTYEEGTINTSIRCENKYLVTLAVYYYSADQFTPYQGMVLWLQGVSGLAAQVQAFLSSFL